jgi:hypothetical protein
MARVSNRHSTATRQQTDTLLRNEGTYIFSPLAFSVKYRLNNKKKSSISAPKIRLASASWMLLAIRLSSLRMALAATLCRV